jgi:hypothetical protein
VNELDKRQSQSSSGILESSGLRACLLRVQKRKRAYGGRAVDAESFRRLLTSQSGKRAG